MKTSTTQVDLLDEIVRRLLEVDGAIRSVVLIGSFVWFPDLARDIDIVVITESGLPADAYWEAVADFPKPVDSSFPIWRGTLTSLSSPKAVCPPMLTGKRLPIFPNPLMSSF
jgi:predicted nucleotidyltransferase